MGFRVIRPEELDWVTRPHEPGEPARHVADAYGTPPESERAEILESAV